VEWGEIGGGVVSCKKDSYQWPIRIKIIKNTAEGGGATRAIPGVELCKSLFFGVDPGEGGTLLESLRAKTNRPRFYPGACR
jgi:hypothetical protein